jgi:Chaperone of endosialidase
MSQPKAPSAPDPVKSYAGGIQTYLKYLPKMLRQELRFRRQYDPALIEQQQETQAKYGPRQIEQQLGSLQQIDPQGVAARQQLGTAVTSDLASGYALPPALRTEIESNIRGAQAARGNIYGAGPTSAEAALLGSVQNQMYQQRLQNVGSFLAGQTPEQRIAMIPPVQAPSAARYVDPNAGYQGQQWGLSNYQNLLAQYQLSGGGRNPWMGALGGAASGAIAGAGVAPPYGAIAGGLIGGVSGYFSDPEAKKNIKPVGKIGIYEYRYKKKMGIPGKFLGPMADEVAEIMPDAVDRDPESGYLKINPALAGIMHERIAA